MRLYQLRKITLVLALLTPASPAMLWAQEVAGSEVLTNDQVVAMVKAGLSAPIIVSKIRSSKTNFNISTDELIRLKQAGDEQYYRSCDEIGTVPISRCAASPIRDDRRQGSRAFVQRKR